MAKTPSTIPRIFVSYSHEDAQWKDRLVAHLRPLERTGAFEVWDTTALQPGADWAKDIEEAARRASVAVLLISPSFLASDFAVNHELRLLLDRQKRGDVAVLPVLVRPTTWSAIPELAGLQFANDPSTPLSSASANAQDEQYASISQRITDVARAIAQRADERAEGLPSGPRENLRIQPLGESKKRHLFVSHSKTDGDFAELLKLKLEQQGHDAWIDADRLDPGIDWRLEIDQAIKDAAAVIAVMTPEARASEYVTYEWAFAWGCGTKVIPIMLLQTTLHPRLATLQYLDFTNRIGRPWTRLYTALSSLDRTSGR